MNRSCASAAAFNRFFRNPRYAFISLRVLISSCRSQVLKKTITCRTTALFFQNDAPIIRYQLSFHLNGLRRLVAICPCSSPLATMPDRLMPAPIQRLPNAPAIATVMNHPSTIIFFNHRAPNPTTVRIRFRRVTTLMRSLEDYFALTFVPFIAVSFESIPFQLCSSLNSAEWPQFCDHFVTIL